MAGLVGKSADVICADLLVRSKAPAAHRSGTLLNKIFLGGYFLCGTFIKNIKCTVKTKQKLTLNY